MRKIPSARRIWSHIRIPAIPSIVVVLTLIIAVNGQNGPRSASPAPGAVRIGREGAIKALAFGPSGSLVAATTGNGAHLWNVDLRAGAKLRRHVVDAQRIALSSDGSLLAVAAESRIAVWDVGADALRVEVAPKAGETRVLAFSHDGARLAVADRQTVTVLETATGQELSCAVPGLGGVASLAFTPDGQGLATGHQNGCVRIWDLETGRQRRAFRAHAYPVDCLRYASDGARLVSASTSDAAVRLWDTATGREVASLVGHTAPVQTACISPDGRTIASAAMNRDVRLWNTATGQQLAVLRGNDDEILSMAFSADGRTLVAGGVGYTIWTWEVARFTGSAPATRLGR